MDYEGLTTDDLANVTALNRAWLDLRPGRIGALSLSRIDRLAEAPFLLFSFREDDDALWQHLLRDSPQADLIEDTQTHDADLRSLQAAGLAFLWELARRNPYVARVVSGATLGWCGKLAGTTLAALLGKVSHQLIICERFAADDVRLERLLQRGAGADTTLREATQMGVLHSLLTQGPDTRQERLPAAACSISLPHRKVADEV
ncbi:MAG: hypothetical protein QNI98_02730 [Woeseiaceae bacterium]|nr:hypothetical protein [Woeseiaceae bacterium]